MSIPYIVEVEKVSLELHKRYLQIQSCLLTMHWLLRCQTCNNFVRNVVLCTVQGKVKQIAQGDKAMKWPGAMTNEVLQVLWSVFLFSWFYYLFLSLTFVVLLSCFCKKKKKVNHNKHVIYIHTRKFLNTVCTSRSALLLY